jgi:flagellar L-ring protein precursor FlgH
MKNPRAHVALSIALAAGLSACSTGAKDFMKEPGMSPVGSGLEATLNRGVDAGPINATNPSIATYPGAAVDLFKDQRITRPGDIVTVIISINDKATFGNTTDRSQTAKSDLSIDWGFTPGSSSGGGSPSKIVGDIASTSTNQGQGNIDRSEVIQVSVAAVVTNVLPNGNLIISGSQEVRVNYELRQLTVAGIVRPSDISRNNTVSYDHIAEARISYGGRGRLMDVQQPNWGQQIYDAAKPF